ncbi:hypothetical protein THAR02_04933 [Trichoderma harzianum]|uniref:Xylanolytic transcriptional activator regulatory domain-containing protein n=1 Tax=Trichoderma harzianum TaxID=5544 RepID=A0A0F9XCX4_TRIHA|nr:hypothetical protein THAR02_04933 [Trichoderma harzianum]
MLFFSDASIIFPKVDRAQQPERAWNAHGLAVRTADKIGLHSKTALAGLRQSEMEARKRIWDGYVVLDRLLAMTLGRLLTILPNLVDMYLPTHHHFPPAAETIRHGESTSDNVFLFIKTILHRGPWEATVEDTDPRNLAFDKLSIVIILRYFNTRILLHRPILSASLHGICQAQDFPRIVRGHIKTCEETACEMVSIIHKTRHSPQRSATWWFAAYYEGARPIRKRQLGEIAKSEVVQDARDAQASANGRRGSA